MLGRPLTGEFGIRNVLLEDAAELGVRTVLPERWVTLWGRAALPKMDTWLPAAAGVLGWAMIEGC